MVYYSVVIAWALRFLIASLTDHLPWVDCESCDCLLYAQNVVYFTAIFPYILLTILLIRGALLEGAIDGIRFYLTPRWDRLADAAVWSDAAVQIFFSLSACSGGLIAMASYNNFNNNVIRDSFLVPVINCLTSFYAGFVVFSTLGYMAHTKQTDIDSVTEGGPGLAFVVYPEAIAQMPVSPLWAILFFIMLCMLGFSSQFSTVETVITAVVDEIPHVLCTPKRLIIFRISVCLAAFLLGLPMVTQGGSYLLDLVDNALLGFPMLAVGLMELLVICIFYGYHNFARDIKCMVGREPFIYFRVCWTVISPVLLMVVIVFKAFQLEPHPVDWANLLYWLCALFPISLVPAWALYYICRRAKMTQPTAAWKERRQAGNKKKTADVVDYDMTVLVETGEKPQARDVTPDGCHAFENKGFVAEKTGEPVGTGSDAKELEIKATSNGSHAGYENFVPLHVTRF
nr:hypothetical protein BaRGS_024723 [Batillaria attramentaria]